ncbi:MAG: HNH endonuclease signature motif containing protein [bacterium]|nr:HNH endonuclease signature motif containing protein [bacterium]
MWARDGGCIGCVSPSERCEAHHIQHWLDDGPTDIPNLAQLCPDCHHLGRDCNIGEFLLWQFDPCLPWLNLVACKVLVKVPQHLFRRCRAEPIAPVSPRRDSPPVVGHFELAFKHIDSGSPNCTYEDSLTPWRVGILRGFLRDLRCEVLHSSHLSRSGNQPCGKGRQVNPFYGGSAPDRGIEVEPVYVHGLCRRRTHASAGG